MSNSDEAFLSAFTDYVKLLGKEAVEVIDAGTHTVCPDGERFSSTRIRRYLKYHGNTV